MRIPPWYTQEFGIPPFLLRTKMRLLTYRQKILAYLARMYYIYSFDVATVYETASLNTHQRIVACKCDGMSRLLAQLFSAKSWQGGALRLLRRLKVLLSPTQGW